jgi:hypothetical protein
MREMNPLAEICGQEHVAQIITLGTLGARAAIRDVGRALGMPYGDVDRVARLCGVEPGLKIALHRTCFQCHKGMGDIGTDPKGCTQICHAKIRARNKFYELRREQCIRDHTERAPAAVLLPEHGMKILDREKMEKIRALLKRHPRGLTITDLASAAELNRNLVANAVAFANWIRGKAGDTFLTALPLFHIYGMATSMTVPVSVEALTSSYVEIVDQISELKMNEAAMRVFLAGYQRT